MLPRVKMCKTFFIPMVANISWTRLQYIANGLPSFVTVTHHLAALLFSKPAQPLPVLPLAPFLQLSHQSGLRDFLEPYLLSGSSLASFESQRLKTACTLASSAFITQHASMPRDPGRQSIPYSQCHILYYIWNGRAETAGTIHGVADHVTVGDVIVHRQVRVVVGLRLHQLPVAAQTLLHVITRCSVEAAVY